MSSELFAIIIANQCLIGILPLVFFRRDGRFTLRWWLMAVPFDLSALGVVLGKFAYASPLPGLPQETFAVLAALIALMSVAMIGWTVGSHRVPLALWHQDNDAPAGIVTWGPYKYVRHPFYTSLTLAELAAFLSFPSLLTAVGLVYALLAFSLTARREERRLLQSAFGSEYRAYMEVTGRLLPGIGRLSRLG
jgi:protein-S-isoprenylcysteine O-methyltransferase Ste14